MPSLVELQNVYVQRGQRYALKGFSLRIEPGEHVAILGPNGSGKSTLIKTITRECYPLLRPETSMRMMGQESWNIFELRSHIGLVSNDLMAQCTRDITGRELVLSGFFGAIGIWPNHVVEPEMEAQGGVGMLLVTHHLDDIIPEIDRVVLLKDGQVLLDGPKRDILTSERLSAVFGVQLEVVERDGYYHAW